MIFTIRNISKTGGYTLIEVLVGIVIFAVGMMALAQLQGNLAKNSGDANARTVATNVAEETIEFARSFGQLTSDGTNHAYADIVDGIATVERAGYTYTVNSDVTDYYYVPASKTFTTTQPIGQVHADFKILELTVSWDDSPQEFRIDDQQKTDGGSGSITMREAISSITSPASGKVVLGTGGDVLFAPPVDYNPGERPEIVSINLGNNKFKESTTPLPDVWRIDELVETAFDVVTYSNPTSGSATFLRREEFRAVSCECTLRIPSGTEKSGFRPTIWNGSDYTEGEFVSKPFGVSASNQQSTFCDICCRDHHDGGNGEKDLTWDTGASRYDPFRSSGDYYTGGSLAGDHKHYNRDINGNLQLAQADGDRYVEACRLVRKDGFFRVAQDLKQQGLNSFPGDYLDETTEVDTYSSYVTAAVLNYENNMGVDTQYEGNPPPFLRPGEMYPAVEFPASSYALATQMSESINVTEQQLRSRGVYIDYMTDELREKINCLDDGGDGESCGVPKVSTSLEIIPFYDVQLTWLARWNETPNNNPVDVTNDSIANDNSHSRGKAMLTSGAGYSGISSDVHNGNLGLTGTDPIDPHYLSNEEEYILYARAVDFGTPPPLSSITISGSILSAVNGVKAADVEIAASEAQCDRTNTGFECVVVEGAKSPSLKIYNYDRAGKVMVACSNELVLQPPRQHLSENGSGSWTNFSLDVSQVILTNIVIKENGC